MRSTDTTTQRAYLTHLTTKVQSDARLTAAWVEGSFGRGNPDRYSDLDIHLLLQPHDLPSFRDEVEVWLASIRPVPLCTLMFEGRMVNALTDHGLRLDLWLHTGDTIRLNRQKAVLLVDKAQHTSYEEVTHPADTNAAIQTLEQQTKEFWRCISLLPSVVGRDEFIVGFGGLAVEVNILTTLLLTGYAIQRDRGVKTLNQFLPETPRAEIEAAVALHGLSRASLVHAHLALARLMQRYGRLFADQYGYPYPTDLEAAVLTYVQNELGLLGLQQTMIQPGESIL
jgi:hypothetical protein